MYTCYLSRFRAFNAYSEGIVPRSLSLLVPILMLAWANEERVFS